MQTRLFVPTLLLRQLENMNKRKFVFLKTLESLENSESFRVKIQKNKCQEENLDFFHYFLWAYVDYRGERLCWCCSIWKSVAMYVPSAG